MITHPVSFNAVQLSTIAGLTVLAVDPYLFPRRQLNLNEIAQSDKSALSSAYYDERSVAVRVGIGRTTRALVEQSRDSLIAMLQGQEGNLIVPQSGGLRNYISTLQDAVFRMAGGAYMHIDLIFACSDRFGYDVDSTQLLYAAGSTAKTRSDSVIAAGNAPSQLPFIRIAYTAISGGALTTVTIGNATTGESMSITRTWAAADVLEIDVLNGTVRVNGVDVEWSGALPSLLPGTNWLTYSDNFVTSRTYNYLVTYYKRWV